MRSLTGVFALLLLACSGEPEPDKSSDDDTDVRVGDDDGDGYSVEDGDCDDADSARSPGLSERCNEVDDDCDGLVDDEPFDGTPFFGDQDGDGYGDAANMVVACAASDGVVDNDLDCDDADSAVSPEAWEACNGVDDDCDRLVDDADTDEAAKRLEQGMELPVPLLAGALLVHPDFDGDGAPTLAGALWVCVPELGYIEPEGPGGPWDCDDEDDAIFPGAAEGVAPGVDLNCDGVASCYADLDGDGHGDAAARVTSPVLTCVAGGVSPDGFDCDDTDAQINHEQPEICDAGGLVDEDCDGFIDEADSSLTGAPEWYLDGDRDGHTSTGPPLPACVRPAFSTSAAGADCRDDREDINPDQLEACDRLDNNCDGQVDEDSVLTPLCYLDVDGDGYGDDLTTFQACDCDPRAGLSDTGGDCGPNANRIFPGGLDVCNGLDDDCSGTPDDDPRLSLMLHRDADGDGFGDPDEIVWRCAPEDGVVDDDNDCDDDAATVFPGAPPVACDLLDNDCDPATFEPGEVRVNGAPAGALMSAVIGAGDEVGICEGRHVAQGLQLPADVTLVGLVPRDRVLLDAAGAGVVVVVDTPLTLRRLTLMGGTGLHVGGETQGGAIWVATNGQLTLDDVRVTASRAGRGGAIWLGEGVTATFADVLLDENDGDAAGAVVDEGGALVAAEGATLDLRGVRVIGNRATRCGGLSLLGDNVVTGLDAVVQDNRSTGLSGGGICAVGATITGVDVISNRSDNIGGGIDGSDLVLRDLQITGNRAALNGGGVYVAGQVELEGVVLDGNVADIEGGGIYLPFDTSLLTLTDCVVHNNRAEFFTASGGGVWLGGGQLVSVDTDWGSGANDNAPDDVGLGESHLTFNRPGVASFTCDDTTGVCQ